MNVTIMGLVVLGFAAAGVVWAYPRVPSPWNYIIVGVVAIGSLMILAKYFGLPLGG